MIHVWCFGFSPDKSDDLSDYCISCCNGRENPNNSSFALPPKPLELTQNDVEHASSNVSSDDSSNKSHQYQIPVILLNAMRMDGRHQEQYTPISK